MQTRRTLLAAGLAAPLLGAWRQPEPNPYVLIGEQGRYVPLLLDLRQKAGAGGDGASGNVQMLAQYLATLGDERGARYWARKALKEYPEAREFRKFAG